MRRSTLLILAASLALAVPAAARPAFFTKARDAGADVEKKCAACHEGAARKGGQLTAMGDFAKSHQKGGEPDYAELAKHYPAKKG